MCVIYYTVFMGFLFLLNYELNIYESVNENLFSLDPSSTMS